MSARGPVRVIDSHTAGEPTRVVLSGAPDLGNGPMTERLSRFRSGYDDFRSGLVCEPRGSEVVVGALLTAPVDPAAAAGVIFFNDVGYLGMCGHGMIGLVHTLAYLKRIAPGELRIETPVGVVTARLHEDGSVTVGNVPSFRHRASVRVDVPGVGSLTGDIAWGGNWFFLIEDHPYELRSAHRQQLTAAATAIRSALRAAGITGADGAEIDHIEFFSAPENPANSSRNFVLCPGASFDRSPCGTGTSAKMACLYADGRLAPGEVWRQEGVLGTVFEGSIEAAEQGGVLPSIRGRAWITGDTELFFAADDPFANGIAW